MNTNKARLLLVLVALVLPLALLTFSLSHASGRSDPADPPYAPDRVIVKLRTERDAGDETLKSPALRSEAAEAALLGHGATAVKRLFDGGMTAAPATNTPPAPDLPSKRGLERVYRMQLERNKTVEQTLAELRADPNVEWAEPDYLAFTADTTPDDPLLPEQWGLAKISAPTAWDTAKGDASVVIAIVDSGVDRSHPDLASKLWTNPGEIAGNGLDDDNNGYIDDVDGWDFVGGDNDPSDDNGHGTQAAGIAGAATNNATGIAGVCWNCKLMSVKVMQAGGVANYSDIAAGVLYAARKGAKVINLSLGGYGNSTALQSAIQEAVDTYGAIVVAGAGNDNVSTPFYPAAYPEALAVAGTDSGDKKSNFSNYGDWVDVSAPGEAITTTFLGGDWGPANGTSFSAPFASGLAGLLRSQHADWSPALVKSQIEHTVDAIDSLNPTYAGQLGRGRIDAGAAVTTAPQPVLAIAGTAVNGDSFGKPTPGQSAGLVVTLSNDWLDANGVQGTLSTTDGQVTINQNASGYGDIPAGGSAQSTQVYTFTVAAGAGYNHAIPFTLHLTANGGGYSKNLSFTITTRSADEHFSGTIGSDMTWTSDKTYIIDANVGVAPGVTLTIQAGTVIKFSGNYNFIVAGTLIADGASSQPIRFLPNNGVTWGHIYFDNEAADAQADANGVYQSGNILRYVEIQGAAEGIDCNGATPYLNAVTLSGGGMSCTQGATPLWVLDSFLVGGLAASGGGTVLHSTFPGGDVSFGGAATINENTIKGGLIVGDASLVSENNVRRGITASGASIVQDNQAGGIFVGDGAQVMRNQVLGDLTTGAVATVMTNTVKSGGLSLGDNTLARFNNIEGAAGWGISAGSGVTLTMNRAVDCANGVNLTGGLVQGNLIANNTGLGLQVNGNVTAISNTLTGNSGSAIKLVSGSAITIKGNNIEGNTGTYDIENRIPKTMLLNVPAQGNWWGTTGSAAIAGRIYDWNDADTTLGVVLFAPAATGPRQDAPAYVRSVTMTPPSPVGIQTAQFDIQFSRPMETVPLTEIGYRSVEHNTWKVYTTSNSGLPAARVSALFTDPDGSHWLGTWGGGVAHFDGSAWTVYNTTNSGLPNKNLSAIAVDPDGSHWFATWGGGAAHFDGSAWTVYNTANSSLPDPLVHAVITDPDGSHWFGTGSGAAHFNGTTWTIYNSGNSGLPHDDVRVIINNPDGSHWFGTANGVAHFDGTTWTTYDSATIGVTAVVNALATDADGSLWAGLNSEGVGYFDGYTWKIYSAVHWGYPEMRATSIIIDPDGRRWFGSPGGAVRFDGNIWKVFDTTNSGLPDNYVHSMTRDADGSHWFGTEVNVGVLVSRLIYPILDQQQWISDDHYRASDEINALTPRGDYHVAIQDAYGADGIKIAPSSNFTFTVDYAGSIADTTPPLSPAVTACGSNTPGTVSASWSAHDPNSDITLYRYAIGTTSGGTDIVNWTTISASSFTRTGLGLVAGQKVYISVMARNDAGLWSLASTPPAITAGSASCTTNSNYSLSLAPAADASSGNPGSTVTYSLAVTNTGNTHDTFNVTVNSAWTANAPATVGPLPPGESASFDVLITIPANAASGVPNQATVTVTSQADSAAHSQAVMTTTANPVYQVSLAPATTTRSGNPGSTVTYNLSVKNNGNTIDSFTVAVSSPWTVNSPATIGPVAAGGNAALNISITIPSGAAGGASSQATVMVTSQANPAVKTQATLATTANPVYRLSLAPATLAQSGNPGTTVTYTLAVTNTGNTSDSFTISISSPWTAGAPATIGPLAPGESKTLNISIAIPTGTANGASTQAVVTVKSQGNSAIQAQTTLTTTATTAPMAQKNLYMPIVRK